MSTITLTHVSSGPLLDITVEFAAGLHVVVGAEHDGTLELMRIATGLARPAAGSIRIAGADPYDSPGTRKTIATSLMDRFEEKTVSQALERRARLKPVSGGVNEMLERAGLARLLARPCHSLSGAEHEAIALATALETVRPIAVLLHQPLDHGTLLSRSYVLGALRRHADTAPIVCTTARPELVSELTDTALWLEAGRLRRATSPTTAPAVRPGVPPTLRVSCTDAAGLARSLASHASIVELRFLRAEGVVEVRGEQLEALCLAVLKGAHAQGITLHQMTQVFPELPEVRAVHAAMARTAYERAYGVLRPPAAGAPK